MSRLNNSLRFQGFREVYYNTVHSAFYAPIPGDNFEELDISNAVGGGTTTTSNVALSNPTTFAALPPIEGLATQQDFNEWIYAAFNTLDGDADVDLDGFAPITWVEENYALKTEIPDSYTKAESDARNYTKSEEDLRFINVNIHNLTHIGDYDEDEDYFALTETVETNIARVRS